MKPLYTEEEFKNAKVNDKLSCECYSCNQPFLKRKGDIQKVLRGVQGFNGKYCSSICASKNKIKEHNLICQACGKEFTRRNSDMQNSKLHFCSKTCSSPYIAKYVIYKDLPKKICKNCPAILNDKSKSYCNNKCRIQFKSEKSITIKEEWLNGTLNLSNKYSYKDIVKKLLMEICDSKCQLCGFSGTNLKTNNSILQIDHIDGNCLNNVYSNVRLICPNCHAMSENYGSLNKNSARVWKRSKYNNPLK